MNTGKKLLAFAGILSVTSTTYAEQRPNIIYIMTDQHIATGLSCAGNTELKTPNIDRLAKAGVRFENAYTASPLSGPARTSMFTGFMPSQIGTEKNNQPMGKELHDTTLGVLLKNSGYDCAYAGKWHAHTASMPDGEFGFTTLHEHNDYGLAESCVDYLNKKHDKPFFLVASFDNPHNICEYARGQELPFIKIEEPELNDCPGLPLNHSRNPYDASVLEREQSLSYALYPSVDFSSDDWRRYLNAYYRMIEHVDGEIGKIVDAIDKNKLWENTVIVFSSDHGDGAAAHKWNQKTVLYEEVANIPFIVTLPGKKNGGKVMPQLINNSVDLMPSVCEWAGVKVPEGRQGVSFKKLIEKGDQQAAHQPYVVTETTFLQTGGTLGWMVRTPKYKYVLYDKGKNREQFYDMETDRGEMRNLAIESKYKPEIEKHRKMLNEWMNNHKPKNGKDYTRFIPTK